MYIIANYFYYSAYLFLLQTSVRLINNNNFSFDKKADVMSHALGWDEIMIITIIIIIILIIIIMIMIIMIINFNNNNNNNNKQ